MDSPLGKEIARISARLNSVDDRLIDLAHAVGVEYGPSQARCTSCPSISFKPC